MTVLKKRDSLKVDQLHSVLAYEPNTGTFTWLLKVSGNVKIGQVAGSSTNDGYIAIKVKGVSYQAHRLAWLYCHGRWPKQIIDHIDGNRANNAIKNLRDVSNSVNLQNQKKPHKDSSGSYLGVSKKRNKWRAQIEQFGIRRYLGLFETEAAANAAYIHAKNNSTNRSSCE